MANPATASLPLSTIINVSVSAPGAQLGVPNTSALAIVTKLTAPVSWAAGQTFAVYDGPTGVANDWGSTSNVAVMANAIFSQSPNLLTGGGYLVVIPRLQSPSLETTQACLVRIAGQVYFQGFLIDEEMTQTNESVYLTLATYVQSQPGLIFFYCSSAITDLNNGSAFAQITGASQTQVRNMYYGGTLPNGETQVLAAAYAGRAFSINFTGVNTVLAMQLQTLIGITPDQTITPTNYLLAQANGVDIYPSVSGVPCVLTSGANLFFDQVYCRAWLGYQLGSNGFNYLKNAAQVPGKIPQTDLGLAGLQDAYTQALIQGVTCGYMAPGSWTAPFSFGDPATFALSITALGYYIVSQQISTQTSAQRASRTAPLFQAAAKEAGALQSSNIFIAINP